MTIVEFLEARLAEDEAVARSAFIDHEPRTAEWIERGNEVVNADGSLVVSRTWNEVTHIARQDPSRALREVAAKRKLVSGHKRDDFFEFDDETTGSCSYCSSYCYESGCRRLVRWPCNQLKTIAAIYSDHPDHQKEWAL